MIPIPIPGTNLVLDIKDPSLDTPEVRAWLEECAKVIGENLPPELPGGADLLFGEIAVHVRPRDGG